MHRTWKDIDERNDALLALYEGKKPEHYPQTSEVARTHGLSEASVRKILKDNKIPQGKRRRKSYIGEVTISRTHRRFGILLNWWRTEVIRLGVRDAAGVLSLSEMLVRPIEAGTYPVTMYEVERICEVIKVNPVAVFDTTIPIPEAFRIKELTTSWIT